MARHSSDSEDDRKIKERRSKSFRKHDRRSRSRSKETRRRSESHSRNSRSYRRRSRSYERESSDESHHRSTRSRKGRDRSRSQSRHRKSEEQQKDKRVKDAVVDKTKQRLKEALNQAETKDDELLKAKEKKKNGKEETPNTEIIAELESNEFVQQSFSSSSKAKQLIIDKISHQDVSLTGTKTTSTICLNILTDSTNSKNLFAARVLEDENKKMERWIKKLTVTRNKLLAAGVFKH